MQAEGIPAGHGDCVNQLDDRYGYIIPRNSGRTPETLLASWKASTHWTVRMTQPGAWAHARSAVKRPSAMSFCPCITRREGGLDGLYTRRNFTTDAALRTYDGKAKPTVGASVHAERARSFLTWSCGWRLMPSQIPGRGSSSLMDSSTGTRTSRVTLPGSSNTNVICPLTRSKALSSFT